MVEAVSHYSLGGYDDEFVDAVDDDWNCPICQLPLKEAVQTGVCGHRFCRQCLDGHFARQQRDGEPLSCPVDRNNLIRDKDIFPDKATQRKILSFIIKCPSEGCEWSGELRSKDNHLASCPHKVVACTNENCHVALPRKDLQKHVTTMCQWRIVPCDHCIVSFPACCTAAHQSACTRFPLSCPNNCGFVIPREEISVHFEKDCELTVISCPYAEMGCTKKIERREVESHFQSGVRLHLDLACIKLSSTQEELRNTKQVLCNIQELFKDTTRKLEEKISALEKKPLGCKEVMYMWKITDFHDILVQAKSKEKISIESDSFYTSPYGYKCRLRIFPNGIGLGLDTHLSIYFVIVKGEYDAILPWPFRKHVTITLIDQRDVLNDRENVTFMLRSVDNMDSNSTVRPVRDQNSAARGFPKFVSHRRLKERQFVVDDTLFIQVEVVSS